MFDQLRRGLAVLAMVLLLGAAVWRWNSDAAAGDDTDDAGDDDTSRGDDWSMTGYYAVEDLAPLRLAVTEWLERYDIVYRAELASGGGGATFSRGRLVFDAGGGGFGDRRRDTDSALTFGGGHGNMGVGVALIQSRTLRIYPLLGFGGMGGGVDNPAAEKPAGGWFAAFFTTGIGLDVRLRVWRFGVLVGMRVGYRHDVMNAQFADGVTFEQPRGPFVRFVIGPYVG